MKIKGKTKDDFEKWFINDHKIGRDSMGILCFLMKGVLVPFWFLPKSMQWGVLVDYFDSCEIHIDIHPILDYNNTSYTKVLEYIVIVVELNKEVDFNREDIEVKSRPQARENALIKAQEIRETQLNK